MKLHKPTLLQIAVWTPIASMFAVLFLVNWWLLYPYKTIKVSPLPFKIVGDRTVHPGDVIMYETEYTKYTDIVPTQYKQFVDGVIYNISDEQSAPVILDKGTGVARIAITIPEGLPSGEYFIHTDTFYELNPIRTIHEETYTEKFTVINKSDEVQDAELK